MFAKKRFNEKTKGVKKGDFQDVLNGHVSFIGNVRGKEDSLFIKLNIRLNTLKNRIDFLFIKNLNVRKRLVGDNLKMERILLDSVHTDDQRFISFCTVAFHQIENLLNYYYHFKYPVFSDLLKFLLDYNENFKKSYKDLAKATAKFKKIKDLSIHVLIYVFEKEFFIERKKEFYDRRISKLREIRNDESHRCTIIELDDLIIINEYNKLQNLKNEHFTINKSYKQLSTNETSLEFKYSLIMFLKEQDFYFVRKILKEVTKIIKDGIAL